MAGLYNHFQSFVSRVTSALATEANAVPVEQVSSKRPVTKNQNRKKLAAQQQKKRALAKKAAKTTRATEDDEPNEAQLLESAEQDEEVLEMSSSDDSTAQEAEALDKMAKAAELKKARLRRKRERRLAREKARKELLESSIVKDITEDALEPERQQILRSLTATYEAIPKLVTPEDITVSFTAAQDALTEFIEACGVHTRDLAIKTPRCDVRNATSNEYRRLIQNLEFSDQRDEGALSRMVEQLQNIISNENQKEFTTKLEEMREAAILTKKKNAMVKEQQQQVETRQRILARINGLRVFNDGEKAEQVEEGDLTSQTMDLTTEKQICLYNLPFQLSRRVERKFTVVLEQSGVGNRRRTVQLWGTAEDVSRCMTFLNLSDLSGKQKMSCERRIMGSIIGRGGAGISALEAKSNGFIHVDVTDVIVLGPPEAAQIVFNAISEINVDVVDAQGVESITIDPMIGRAVQALYRAKVSAVERDIKGRIIFIINPSDGQDPRILVRCRQDYVSEAVGIVQKELVDTFVHLTFPGSARAVTRLLVPPRNSGENSLNRLVHQEFRSLRESYGLFIERIGRGEDEEETGMHVVCYATDKELIQEKCTELLRKADFTTYRMPVEKEQLAVFTPENRGLIEVSSGIRFSSSRAQENGPAHVVLVGTDEAIAAGKKVIMEILQREGQIENYNFVEADAIVLLLRDRGLMITELEGQYDVSINVNRDSKTARIIGDKNAILEAVGALKELENERREHKANLQTVSVSIPASRVGAVIGRGGSMIRDIRQKTGVDRIDIPTRTDASEGETTEIVISGLKAAVAEAKARIEDLTGIPLKSPPRPPRGRGRGRPASAMPTVADTGERTMASGLAMEEFPSIEQFKGQKQTKWIAAYADDEN